MAPGRGLGSRAKRRIGGGANAGRLADFGRRRVAGVFAGGPKAAGNAGGALGLLAIREALAYCDPLWDTCFAVQGLTLAALHGSSTVALSTGLPSSGPDANANVSADVSGVMAQLLAGTRVGAFAVTEPGAGSDLGAIETVVKPALDETDVFVMNGRKIYISNATEADWLVVLARVEEDGDNGVNAGADQDPEKNTKRGPTGVFLVPRAASGVSVKAQPIVGGHPLGAVSFDDVRIPAGHRLDTDGRGVAHCLGVLGQFRMTVGAAACGMMRRALAETLSRAQNRHQFGGPLSSLPGVSRQLTDLVARYRAAWLTVLDAAWQVQTDASLTLAEKSALSANAKVGATEAAFEIVDGCVQIHGAAGLAEAGTVARLWQQVRATRIYEGANDVLRGVVASGIVPAACR